MLTRLLLLTISTKDVGISNNDNEEENKHPKSWLTFFSFTYFKSVCQFYQHCSEMVVISILNRLPLYTGMEPKFNYTFEPW